MIKFLIFVVLLVGTTLMVAKYEWFAKGFLVTALIMGCAIHLRDEYLDFRDYQRSRKENSEKENKPNDRL